jgi:SNF2 family DNA or RNA helicase
VKDPYKEEISSYGSLREERHPGLVVWTSELITEVIQDDQSTSPLKGVGDARFVLRFPQVDKNKIILGNVIYDFTEHTLFFHPFLPLFEEMDGLFQRSGELLSDAYRSAPLFGHEQIDRLKSKIEIELGDFLKSSEVYPKPQKIEDYSVQYHFESERFGVSVSFQDGEVTHTLENIPNDVRLIIVALAKGFNNFERLDLDEVKRRRRARKQLDTKLLKHRGVVILYYYDCLRYLLSENQSDDSEFLEHLFLKMVQLLSESPAQAALASRVKSPVQHLISREITRELEKEFYTLKGLVGRSLRVYSRSSVVELKGVYTSYLKFIFEWIKKFVEVTEGECFDKPAKEYFDHPDEDLETGLLTDRPDQRMNFSLKWLDKEANTFRPWSILPDDERFEGYYFGKKMDRVEASDFRSYFELKGPDSSEVSGQQGIDWFEISPQFFLGDEELEASEAQKLLSGEMIEKGDRTLFLKGSVDETEKRALSWYLNRDPEEKEDKKTSKKSIYKLQKSEILDLLALRSAGVHIKGGKLWNDICEFYDSLDDQRKPFVLPASFVGDLKPYQSAGVAWMYDLYRLRFGAILADDMGLGKTIQTLAFFDYLRERNEMKRCLVVVPTSLTYNWLSEAERFTPHLKMIRFQTKEAEDVDRFLKENEDAVVVVSYGLFSKHIKFFENWAWNIQVFDEAQHLKNISANRTTAARRLKSNFKICLTGTPLENHYDELYSLVDLILPGALGRLKDFKSRFVNVSVVPQEEISFLRKKLQPLVKRRTKNEIASDLPSKKEIVLKIPFDQKQKRIYRDIANSWNDRVRESIDQGGESGSQIIMLTALLRLRQACSDPSGIPHSEYDRTPPKIETLLSAIREITEAGSSALIFTQFLSTLKRIESLAAEGGIPIFTMQGSMSQKQRDKTISSFNSCPSGAVLCMTLKTGGVGLNLTKANYVFHLEPWWNPAVEDQATDRTHRIGQDKPVTVYRYLMKESVEEKVELLKSRKAERFMSVFGDFEKSADLKNVQARLSKEDFDYLLG